MLNSYYQKIETFHILHETLSFFQTHPDVKWDLVYISYRNIKATRMFEVSKDNRIYLWRASRVLSTTAFIVNKRAETVAKLNKCYLEVLMAADQAISHCLKSGLLRAFLLEPKLASNCSRLLFQYKSL